MAIETVRATLLKGTKFEITNPDRRVFIKAQKSDRLKSLGQIQEISDLTRIMWQCLQIYQSDIVFEPAFPPYVLDKEDAEIQRAGRPAPEIPDKIITWQVIRRTPGSVDHTAFSKTREIRPRIREELVYDKRMDTDSYEPEGQRNVTQLGENQDAARVYGMQVKGQFFDNLIQFDMWSKNNRTAEEMAEFFERFMESFHDMFIELGVCKIHFQARLRDEFLAKWRNGLVNRSLLYYVRLERIMATPVREIKTIRVNMEYHKLLRTIDDGDIDGLISEYQNNLVRNWAARNQLLSN